MLALLAVFVLVTQCLSIGTAAGSSPDVGRVEATIAIGGGPMSLVYNPVNHDVYVVDFYSGNVSIINDTRLIGGFPVGVWPQAVTCDPHTGDLYVVAGMDDAEVEQLTPTGLPVRNLSVGTGIGGLAFNDANGLVYASELDGNNVSVLSDGGVIARIPVGMAPGPIAYDPSDGNIYVANTYSNSLSVLNGTTVVSTVGSLTSPSAIGVDPQDGTIWVGTKGDDGGWVYVVKNSTTLAGVATGFTAADIASDPADGMVYVAESGDSALLAFSGQTLIGTLNVGSSPSALAYDPATGNMYAAITGGLSGYGTVVVIAASHSVAPSPGTATWEIALGGISAAAAGGVVFSLVQRRIRRARSTEREHVP